MTVFVPFISNMLKSDTYQWTRGRPDVEMYPLRSDDNRAYWRMLNFLWSSEHVLDDLTIVEHDMLPAPNVIEEMTSCDEPWCTSPYRCSPADVPDLIDGLGCTSFSKALRLAHPEVMRVVSCIADHGVPAKDWRRLDVRIASVLRGFGYEPHTHRRSIHLHYEAYTTRD